ncbi:hypothetical protein L210DRAFT_3532928 [Boletus edulis BED1]|uniref:Secreted protein n=1 Tax=Boletus edulis BED1 TaxID=1328754 RepID=A0AAD4GH98_BOLED|nr:hypothetical protein L210DRAFT_3532928 [Boletus edulis BED1]
MHMIIASLLVVLSDCVTANALFVACGFSVGSPLATPYPRVHLPPCLQAPFQVVDLIQSPEPPQGPPHPLPHPQCSTFSPSNHRVSQPDIGS